MVGCEDMKLVRRPKWLVKIFINYRFNRISDNHNIPSLPLDPMLRIWKMDDPMTKNRRSPSTNGPIGDFDAFFLVTCPLCLIFLL